VDAKVSFGVTQGSKNKKEGSKCSWRGTTYGKTPKVFVCRGKKVDWSEREAKRRA